MISTISSFDKSFAIRSNSFHSDGKRSLRKEEEKPSGSTGFSDCTGINNQILVRIFKYRFSKVENFKSSISTITFKSV